MKGDHVGILELKARHLAHMPASDQSPFQTPLVSGCDRISAARPCPLLFQQAQGDFGFDWEVPAL